MWLMVPPRKDWGHHRLNFLYASLDLQNFYKPTSWFFWYLIGRVVKSLVQLRHKMSQHWYRGYWFINPAGDAIESTCLRYDHNFRNDMAWRRDARRGTRLWENNSWSSTTRQWSFGVRSRYNNNHKTKATGSANEKIFLLSFFEPIYALVLVSGDYAVQRHSVVFMGFPAAAAS